MSLIKRATKLLEDFPELRRNKLDSNSKKKKGLLERAQELFNSNFNSVSSDDYESSSNPTEVDIDLDTTPSEELFHVEEIHEAEESLPPTETDSPLPEIEAANSEEAIVNTISEVEEVPEKLLEDFSGDVETIEAAYQDSGSDESSILDAWEKDALNEASREIEEISDSTNKTDNDSRLEEDDASDDDFLEKEVKSKERKQEPLFSDDTDPRIESYVVTMEITKDLLNSQSVDEYFENLMFAINAQIAPEMVVIFGSRNEKNNELRIMAFDGIDIESDIVVSKHDMLYKALEGKRDLIHCNEILSYELSKEERDLIENPMNEFIIPMHVADKFSGFIIVGKKISGDEYETEDYEFITDIFDISGNFLGKLYYEENLYREINELNKTIQTNFIASKFASRVYSCKDLFEINDVLTESLRQDLGITDFTFLRLNTGRRVFKGFSSTLLSQETLDKFFIPIESKIVTMVSQVCDVYKFDNFATSTEITENLLEDELRKMGEFTVLPLINIGTLVGMIIIHNTPDPWTAATKQNVISVANILAPIVSNLILQEEKESFFKNPLNPLEETISRAMVDADESGQSFTLIILKILYVTRILTILGSKFFSDYSEFIANKILTNTSDEDSVSRIGQGKFAIILKGKNKAVADQFTKVIKEEILKFHSPSKEFKLSVQLYSLTYPEQAKEKRKFIELMEET